MRVSFAHNHHMKNETIAIAALTTDLAGSAPTEIQLTPDGLFRAKDGRPAALSGWLINAEIAQSITGYTSGKVATVDKPFNNAFAIGAAYSIGGYNNGVLLSQTGVTTTAVIAVNQANQITLGATASTTAGYYVGATVTVTDSTGLLNIEKREIIAYTAGKVATLSAPLTLAKAVTDKYSIGAANVYTPVSSIAFPASASASFYFNLDGVRHVLIGARGTVSFDVSAKKVPTAKWSFTGLLGVIPIADALDTITATWTTPVTVSTANTTDINILGTNSGVFETMTIDVANDVKYRQLIGSESVLTVDRSAKGSISLEAGNIAAKDWFAAAKTSATGVFSFKHGTIAGNIINFFMPSVQIANPKYSDSDSIAMIGMDLHLIPVSGNDELRITVK